MYLVQKYGGDYLKDMEDFAIKLAKEGKYRIWIDGCVTYETFQRLKDSGIYCAVIGRGIFQDKEFAVAHYCK